MENHGKPRLFTGNDNIYFPPTVKGMRRHCSLWAILDNYADITANYGVRMNLEKELEIKLIGCFILVAIIPFLFG